MFNSVEIERRKEEREQLWEKMAAWEKENGKVKTAPRISTINDLGITLRKELKARAEPRKDRTMLRLRRKG